MLTLPRFEASVHQPIERPPLQRRRFTPNVTAKFDGEQSTQAQKERINKQLREEEFAPFGEVRLPWVALPGMHPFYMHWCMGEAESHMAMLSLHASRQTIPERIAQLRRYGIPADWVWWAWERIAALDPQLIDPPCDPYDLSFEEVRDVLVGHGIELVGEPEK